MINFKEIGQKILGIAPTLASTLGGPAAGLTVSLIADAFGANPQDDKDILTKVFQDPEYVVKLKELEGKYAEELHRLETKMYALEIKDKENARRRELEIIKLTGKEDPLVRNMAYLTLIGFFGTLYVLFSQHLNLTETERNLAAMLIGILTGSFQTVMNYIFGTSRTERQLGEKK